MTLALPAALSAPDRALLNAATARDVTAVRAALRLGADVNACDARHRSALLLAVADVYAQPSAPPSMPCVQALLRAGADRNAADDCRQTPLMAACHEHNVKMVRTLLEAGADPNAVDRYGQNALIFLLAVVQGPTPTVRPIMDALIAAGVDVTAPTKAGETALNFAVSFSTTDVVARLLTAGAGVQLNSPRALALLIKHADGDEETNPGMAAFLQAWWDRKVLSEAAVSAQRTAGRGRRARVL